MQKQMKLKIPGAESQILILKKKKNHHRYQVPTKFSNSGSRKQAKAPIFARWCSLVDEKKKKNVAVFHVDQKKKKKLFLQ